MAPPGARPSPPPRVQRLVHKADFVRLLDVSAIQRSTHFAVHHLASVPMASSKRVEPAETDELSTDGEQVRTQGVDNIPTGHWIGCVVPKRHARRSVTRSLLKRQIRAAIERHAAGLPCGLWLVRLRSPFVPKLFVSAASRLLADTARLELDALLARATTRTAG